MSTNESISSLGVIFSDNIQIAETETGRNDNNAPEAEGTTEANQILNQPGPSGVINYPASSGVNQVIRETSHFSPEAIRPFPKASLRSGKNKRRLRKSAILTDTPEKQALAEEQSKKRKIYVGNEEIKKYKGKGKGKEKQSAKMKINGKKTIKGKHAKRKILQSNSESSEDEDDDLEYYCLVCCDPYSNSRSGEEWVQCQDCKNWAHSRCGKNRGFLIYTCPNCDSDESFDD